MSKNGPRTVVFLILLLFAATTRFAQRGGVDAEETADILAALDVEEGDVVADVGAGRGALTVAIAKKVGPPGQVLSTEVDDERLEDIHDRVQTEGLDNVSVVWGWAKASGLPPSCCDAILLRRVYHHFVDDPSMPESLARGLRPGGRIVVVDFEPRSGSDRRRPEGVPDNRGGHAAYSGAS